MYQPRLKPVGGDVALTRSADELVPVGVICV
jgi:hypothetical protein